MARRRWESAVPRMMRAAGTTRERSPTAEDQRRGASAPSHHVCVCTRILSTLLTVAYRVESQVHIVRARHCRHSPFTHWLLTDWLDQDQVVAGPRHAPEEGAGLSLPLRRTGSTRHVTTNDVYNEYRLFVFQTFYTRAYLFEKPVKCIINKKVRKIRSIFI